MPTYHSPPQSPITTPPSAYRFPSRSHSFSTSTSASKNDSSSSSSSRSRPSHSRLSKDEEDAARHKQKIPYLFLGSIAAASLVAHKYWPKGFPHSDKEDWELSGLALRTKQRRLAEKAEKAARRVSGGRDHYYGSGGSSSGRGFGYGYDDPVGARGGSGGYPGDTGRGGTGGYYYALEEGDRFGRGGSSSSRDDRGWDRDRGGERRPSATHGVPCWSHHGRDRDYYGVERGGVDPSYRRTTSRERTERLTETERGYPPAPKRYLLGQSAFTAGPSGSGSRYLLERSSSNNGLAVGSRFPTSAPHGYYGYEERRPSEAVYVYRDPPPRPRRASFDVGVPRRYGEGYDWYLR